MKENQKNLKNYRTINLVFFLLLAILFIVTYTFILQKNYSSKTLESAEKKNIACSDTIYKTVSDFFTKEDYTEINSVLDMKSGRYQALQKRLNEIRMVENVRYLYTAKRAEDGTLVYLVDGLNLGADDFAYPGTAIEKEMIPYLERALSGEKVYSQEIVDTTWGHIFTACYPIYADDDDSEIVGVLCMELDMESTYQAIKANNNSAAKIAVVAAILAVFLVVYTFFSLKDQKKKELRQQQILEESVAAADAANKAKSTFLFNMSHDIRTPMNAILGFSDLARKNLDDKKKVKEYMDNIYISGEKLLSIINNVLEFSRIENNETIIEESLVKTGEGFDSCIIMTKTALEEKHQILEIEKNVLYPYMYIDLSHMVEVVINIMGNAVKYTGEGGKIRCVLNQFPHEKDGWCITEVIIEDNGIGMSEEFQKHIFEAFTRERSSTISGIDGTGLGMGIVKKLVDLMGGTISVKSKLGEGSKFTVRIPCRIAREESISVENEEQHLDNINLTGKRILLAEDNDLNAEIAIELLTAEGILVERAEDGVVCVEMLEKAAEDYYDLILMDIQMPIMNGYKATQVIRSMDDLKKANIPIIAMTANAFDEDRRKALAVGMNEHIAKPVDINKLLALLKKILNVENGDKNTGNN